MSVASIKLLDQSYINTKYAPYQIMMDIDKTSFLPVALYGVDTSIANAIRRIIMSEIKNLAFSPNDIKLSQNKSQYHNEVLIKRFGYITINMDYVNDNHIKPNDIKLILSSKDNIDEPLKNDTQSIMKVYLHQHLSLFISNKKLDIKQLCPHNSLLLTLRPREEIRAEMIPSYGIGLQNAIWHSGICAYKFATDTDIKAEEDDEHVPYIETNEELLKYIGHDRKKPVSIILTVESIGKFTSINLLKQSISVINEKVERIEKMILSSKLDIDMDKNTPYLAKYRINNEDHTIGNVLEYYSLMRLIYYIKKTVENMIQSETIKETDKDDEMLKLITQCVCGYRKVHPDDQFIELCLQIPHTFPLFFVPDQYVDQIPSNRIVLGAISDIKEILGKIGKTIDSI